MLVSGALWLERRQRSRFAVLRVAAELGWDDVLDTRCYGGVDETDR